VNKSLIKFLTDFTPLLVFFIIYKKTNSLNYALPPLIGTTIIALIVAYLVEKKIAYVPLIGAIIVCLFGGLTLYFDNPIFIYMKPTIVNLLFAIILIVSNIFFKKNLIKLLLNSALILENQTWDKLNLRWSLFFLFLAVLNEIVWRTQSESFWVTFKVWGILPLTIIFTALQIPLIKNNKLENNGNT